MENSKMKPAEQLKMFSCCEDGRVPSLPQRGTNESSCYDIAAKFHAATVTVYSRTNSKFDAPVKHGNFILHAGERALIPTGWKMKIPHGYQVKLLPRSGLALKYGITLINTPGTIDSDYTDEVKIILHNSSEMAYTIREGDNICQMEMVPNYMRHVQIIQSMDFTELEEHKASSNRDGGFGSTGK